MLILRNDLSNSFGDRPKVVPTVLARLAPLLTIYVARALPKSQFWRLLTHRDVLEDGPEIAYRIYVMFTDYRCPDGPSGRHGGPSASPVLSNHHARGLVLSATHECYVIAMPYPEAVSRTRRAVSRHGLQILRECDVGSHVPDNSPRGRRHCRVFYVTQPDLLATAVSTHPSAALWLPLPVALNDETLQTRIFFPAEAIVRDRANLLGIRGPVSKLYTSLIAALETIGERSGLDVPADFRSPAPMRDVPVQPTSSQDVKQARPHA